VHRGDLNDPASLRTGAAGSDGVLHLAFGDFNNFPKSIAERLSPSRRSPPPSKEAASHWSSHPAHPSCPDVVSTEQDPFLTDGPLGGRGRNAQTVLDLA